MPLSRNERAYCCTGPDEKVDMCGRTGCTWPCPTSSISTDYNVVINRYDDKAFFLETSGRSSLNIRQACAVESLAKLNPNLTVLLLITGEHDEGSLTSTALSANYPNVVIAQLDVGDYVAGTVMERWYHCSNWNRGWYPVAHLSDALRFLTLSRFGGYYFDLDVVQLRPVTSYRNFSAVQDSTKIAIGAMHFEHGHPVIDRVAESFPGDYTWFLWTYAGVDLITRTLQDWCRERYVPWMTPEKCSGFRVLDPRSFYPIQPESWFEYFRPRGIGERASSLLDDEHVIGAHVWNYFSSSYYVQKASNQFYNQLARRSCPKVFEVAPAEF